MDAKQQAVRELMQTHVMFSQLSVKEKVFLAKLIVVKVYDKEDVIALQGNPINGFYYINSGEVRLKQTRDNKRGTIGSISSKGSFGELSLVKDCFWEYQIEAEAKTIMLILPAKPVRQTNRAFPKLSDMLKKQVGMVELMQRLRGILAKSKYTSEQFNAIVEKIGIKRFEPNQMVFNQGDDDQRLYYIEQGAVELLWRSITGENIVLDKVVRGELLGENGALSHIGEAGKQVVSARAVTPLTVLVFYKPEVDAILDINPELHEQLRLRAQSLREQQVLESNARQKAEGADLRVHLADAVTEEEFKDSVQHKQIRKFPLINQLNESDCAANCITMICRHYGKDFTAGQIKELTNLNGANADPNHIAAGAETLGFQTKAYGITYEQLQTLPLPGIIGWENYHYAVLYRITKKEVFLADPAKGLIRLPKEEFIQGWTQALISGAETNPDAGLFIAIQPTVKFTEKEPPKKPIYHFINYLLPYKVLFFEAFLAALTINLLGLASPIFIQTIVDTVVVHHDVSLLNMMLAGMVLVAIFKTLSVTAQSLLLAHTTARIDMKMMSEFYRHILDLPMGFFMTRNKGEILARFGENAKIRAIIAGSSITVVLNTLMIFLYFLVMFTYNTTLTIVVMFYIPLYIAIIWYYTPRIKAIAQERFVTNSQSQAHLIESLNGIESIKATANEYMARARWEESFVENVNKGYTQQKLNLMSMNLNQLVSMASTVTILWIGANQVIANEMTIGELMGFNMLVGLVMGPVMQMVGLWNNIQEVRIAIERVSDILNVEPEQKLPESGQDMPVTLNEVEGRIEFKNVDFSYVANNKENRVMKEFNLVIEAGMRVAFVGASGCGKSTIAKMILGFNKPTAGECTIDGKDITSIDTKSLRQNIGVVLQDSFIFSGSVAENIALGDPQPDMAAVKEAAQLSGAHEFIVNYPLGYQTAIGEKGLGISGGQRQRICIARALYFKPKILIFDEATSALDNESEKRIQQNMHQILAGKSSITIAHRLSTITASDMICYIHDGKVLEKGTHEELTSPEYIKTNNYEGAYYALAKDQFDLPPLEGLINPQENSE